MSLLLAAEVSASFSMGPLLFPRTGDRWSSSHSSSVFESPFSLQILDITRSLHEGHQSRRRRRRPPDNRRIMSRRDGSSITLVASTLFVFKSASGLILTAKRFTRVPETVNLRGCPDVHALDGSKSLLVLPHNFTDAKSHMSSSLPPKFPFLKSIT